MDIIACGSRPSRKMGAPSFTGTVWQDPIIEAPAPARIRAARVALSPGRVPRGIPIRSDRRCTSSPGIGRVQTWGGPIREIRAGDTVWIPPGEKHWHGATPTSTAWYISPCRNQLGGEHVTWLEPVTDEQYKAKPAG